MKPENNSTPGYLRKPGVQIPKEQTRAVSLKCKSKDKPLMYDARDLIEAYPSEMKKLFELLTQTKKGDKPIKEKLKDMTALLTGKYALKEVAELQRQVDELQQQIEKLQQQKPFITGTEKPTGSYIYLEEPRQVLPKPNYL